MVTSTEAPRLSWPLMAAGLADGLDVGASQSLPDSEEDVCSQTVTAGPMDLGPTCCGVGSTSSR